MHLSQTNFIQQRHIMIAYPSILLYVKIFKVMERILRARGAVRVSPIWPTYCETSTPSAWTVAVPDVGGPHQMAAMVRPHAQSGSSSSDYRRTWTLCRKSIGTNLRWTPELRIGSVYRRSSNFRCDLFCPNRFIES